MALNACELEIDLFCQGMRVPEHVSLAGARGVSAHSSGLGSGLEVVLPTGSPIKDEIWLNVPVVESFARYSPHTHRRSHDGYAIVDTRSDEAIPSARHTSRCDTALDVARRADEPDWRAPGHLLGDLRQSCLRILELRPRAQLPLLHDRPERRTGRSLGQSDRGRRRDVPRRKRGIRCDVRPPQRRFSRITRPAIHGAIRSGHQGTSRDARRRAAGAGARLQRVRPLDPGRRRSPVLLRRADGSGVVRAHLPCRHG